MASLITSYYKQLNRADLRNKMISPETNLDQLVQRIQTEVAKQKAVGLRECATSPDNSDRDFGSTDLQAALIQGQSALRPIEFQEASAASERANFITNANGTYSLQELTAFHGSEFIQNAYLAILQRAVDSDGLATYLNLLKKGMAKLEILGILRNCEEGRRAGSRVTGLTWRYHFLRASRFPIVGRLVGLMQYFSGLAETQRAQREFEAWVFDANETTQIRLQQVNKALSSLSDGLSTSHALLDAKAAKADVQGQMVMARSQFRVELDQQAIVLQTKLDREELQTSLASLEKTLSARVITKSELASVEDAIEKIRQALDSLVTGKADRSEMTTAQGVLRSAIHPLEMRVTDLRINLLDQGRRVGLLLEEARKRLPAPFSNDQLKTIVAEDDHRLDSLYASFEDRFRGTRSDIKQRQSIYLPYIRDSNAGLTNAPVLDLGCGRGEWLELLRESGLEARGIDVNRIFLAACRDVGLDVVDQDVLSYLRNINTDSVGAVTCFHLIEHLPLGSLIALFDESLRVLKPGGVAIFESPNPGNLVVGSCNFYFDPTHRNPLPAPLTQALIEIRGFSRTEILYLHPDSANQLQPSDQPVQQTLNKYLYGPQDYAVLARKV